MLAIPPLRLPGVIDNSTVSQCSNKKNRNICFGLFTFSGFPY